MDNSVKYWTMENFEFLLLDFTLKSKKGMNDLEDVIKPREFNFSEMEVDVMKSIISEIIGDESINDRRKLRVYLQEAKHQIKVSKRVGFSFRYMDLRYIYGKMVINNEVKQSIRFENLISTKNVRVDSGVAVYTIQTNPFQDTGLSYHQILNNPETIQDFKGVFTCKYDCAYCPNFPLTEFTDTSGKKVKVMFPRSYVPGEPSPERALRNDFDPVLQIHDRGQAIKINGHSNDKAELIIEGGTWESHDLDYRRNLIRMCFYAFNTMYINRGRNVMTLEEEMKENERTDIRICHVIGITIETRPDQISLETVLEYRRLGITRVQLGVQTTDDTVLKKNRRKCTTDHARRANAILLNAGFKTDAHIMFGLPGATYESDVQTIEDFLSDSYLKFDQVKLYPTIIIDHSLIKKWHDEGKYKPYFEDDFELLLKVVSYFQQRCPKWIRINRTQRDVPVNYYTYENKIKTQLIYGGSDKSNLRQMVDAYMADSGMKCMDIHSREVRDRNVDFASAELSVLEYSAAGGREFFLSYEFGDVIFAFLRLRLPSSNVLIDELKGCAMIRELHVYGRMTDVGDFQRKSYQHLGFGSKLILEAERISKSHGYTKLSVISGVGVRSYYRNKHNFTDGKYYQIKSL